MRISLFFVGSKVLFLITLIEGLICSLIDILGEKVKMRLDI